jgi:hypothetical protein
MERPQGLEGGEGEHVTAGWERLAQAKAALDAARDDLSAAAYDLCDLLGIQRWGAPMLLVELEDRQKRAQRAG